MLIGAVSRILGVIDWQATKKLSGLVINVTQPLLIIGAFQTSYSADKLKIALSLIGVSAVILVALSFLASLFFKGSEKADRNVLEFGTVFANWSYLGYPHSFSMYTFVFTVLYYLEEEKREAIHCVMPC